MTPPTTATACPLCQRPCKVIEQGSDLEGHLGGALLKGVEVQFPHWLPRDGLCHQCIQDAREHGAVWTPTRIS